MKDEQLAIEILRELVRNAGQTMIENRFAYWHSQYHGDRFCYNGDVEEALNWLDRLKGCFGEEEINKILDEAEEDCRAKVDPQVLLGPAKNGASSAGIGRRQRPRS